jgi:IS30 family transposase
MGPISPVTSYKKNRYIICIVDDFTRYLQVFILKSKTEVPQCMKEALRFFQAKYPGAGQFDILYVDNGPEFICEPTSQILDKFIIVNKPAIPECHQHNGTAERANRTIQERGRALLFKAGFPLDMWELAIQTACYLYNRTPHSSMGFKTPFELLYHKLPDLSNI